MVTWDKLKSRENTLWTLIEQRSDFEILSTVLSTGIVNKNANFVSFN